MYSIVRAVSSIQACYRKGFTVCELSYSSVMLSFIKVLRRDCLLYGCTFFENVNLVSIYLRYSGRRPVFTKMGLVSKPGARYFLKLKNRSYRWVSASLIVSNSRGFFSSATSPASSSGEFFCRVW